MKSLIILLLMSMMFTSCGFKVVDNGNVAIVVDSFSQNVHDHVKTSGLSWNMFTSYYEVDATDIRIQVKDLQPKDKKGMKFENVDLTTTVRLKKDKAVTLYKETKEIIPRENGSPVLGLGKLEQIVHSATVKAFQEFEYQEFVNDRTELEARIESKIKEGISKLMYDAYEVKDVDSKTINLMPDIEKSFQNRSLVAQKRLLIKSEEKLMIEKLQVEEKEMQRLKEIASGIGITVKDLMDYKIAKERNEVLSDFSKSSGSNVLLQLDKK